MNDKFLLVEDHDHRGVASAIFEKTGIKLEISKNEFLVKIEVISGVEKLLKYENILNYANIYGVNSLGLIVDADDKFQSRWNSIIEFCKKSRFSFSDIPQTIPKNGFIIIGKNGFRFGAWIMPDNVSNGNVEVFCKSLIDKEDNKLWLHAEKSTAIAKAEFGAPYKDAHKDRAELLAYLSWQNKPLSQMGLSITKNKLNCERSPAKEFLAWFQELYQL